MTTKTVETDWAETVDPESFISASEEATESEERMEGIAILQEAKYVEDEENVLEKHNDILHYNLTNESQDDDSGYFIFKAKDIRSGDDIVIIAKDSDEYDEIDKIKEWTDVSDIGSLAGKSVPVQKVDDQDYFVFPDFDDIDVPFDSISEIKEYYELGAIEYKDGQWTKSDKMERHDETIDYIQENASKSFWIILLAGLFIPHVMVGNILLAIALSMLFMDWFLSKRNKPIQFILKRS